MSDEVVGYIIEIGTPKGRKWRSTWWVGRPEKLSDPPRPVPLDKAQKGLERARTAIPKGNFRIAAVTSNGKQFPYSPEPVMTNCAIMEGSGVGSAGTAQSLTGATVTPPKSEYRNPLHMPLAEAYLCQDCDCIVNRSQVCPSCASGALMSLAGVLNRTVAA